VDTDTLVEHLLPEGWGDVATSIDVSSLQIPMKQANDLQRSKVKMTIDRAVALQKLLMLAIFVTVHTMFAVAMLR
jgi:hypothetical protein